MLSRGAISAMRAHTRSQDMGVVRAGGSIGINREKYNKYVNLGTKNFLRIWDGASRWVQNTHTGCGYDFHTSRNMFWKGVLGLTCLLMLSKKEVVQIPTCVYTYRPKCYSQTDRMDHGTILRFRGTNSFCWRSVTNNIPEVTFPLFKFPYS